MAQQGSNSGKTNAAPTKTSVVAKTFWKDEFPLIRRSSLILGLCTLLAIIFIGGSRHILLRQQENRLQAESELSQAQEKFTTINNEKNDIRDFQPRYLGAVQRGFIGEESRLDIVERVRMIQEQYKLLPLKYEILPQQGVLLDPNMVTGELELRVSRMIVHMGLLHEGDLFSFLGEISKMGQIFPKACSMVMIDNTDAPVLSAKIESECELYWVTMGRRVIADANAAPVQ